MALEFTKPEKILLKGKNSGKSTSDGLQNPEMAGAAPRDGTGTSFYTWQMSYK